MAILRGKDGKILADGVELAEIVSWTFQTRSVGIVYSSSATGGYRRRLPGARQGTGRFEFKINPAALVTDSLQEGSEITLQLFLNASLHYLVPAVIDELNVATEIATEDFIHGTCQFSTTAAWSVVAGE